MTSSDPTQSAIRQTDGSPAVRVFRRHCRYMKSAPGSACLPRTASAPSTDSPRSARVHSSAPYATPSQKSSPAPDPPANETPPAVSADRQEIQTKVRFPAPPSVRTAVPHSAPTGTRTAEIRSSLRKSRSDPHSRFCRFLPPKQVRDPRFFSLRQTAPPHTPCGRSPNPLTHENGADAYNNARDPEEVYAFLPEFLLSDSLPK